MLLFFFFGSYYNYRMKVEVIANGIAVKVSIFDVSCVGRLSNLWFRDSINIVHHVNLDPSECLKYNPGDTISLLYNAKNEIYYLPQVSFNEEKGVMLFSGIAILLSVIYFILPNSKLFKPFSRFL